MKNFIIIFFVLLTTWAESFSQILPSSREIGMSNSTIADSNSAFALFYNPACLSRINYREIGLYYSPSPFGLKELANVYAVYTEPLRFISAAIGIKSYGFNLYKENEITLGLSKSFEERYFAGVSFAMSNISINKYGQKNLLSAAFGNNIRVDDNLSFAAVVRNIQLGNYSKYLRKSLILEVGTSYRVNSFLITAALQKEEYFDLSYAFGVEISLIKYIDLRAGFRNLPNSFSFGIGINYSFVKIDYSAFNNFNLGLTHQFGLLIHIDK
ncbi:MAG: hypothetical protein CO129_05305 [Ignavibacteriales bacterium CG_4_9_14_3_um_filter_34_10]|nr:MAG: hypothetical protein CO129_05305 [Ignavibacteriales bacterium CG_4_9_14_3_um_filter_34_10]